MQRKGIGEDSVAADEHNTRKEEGEGPSEKEKVYPSTHSHRELGTAIFNESNPVKAGRELLEKSNDATRLSALRAFADWAFGKDGAEGNRKPPRIIWDIPGPPYEPPCEPLDPELEKLEGGEK